MPKKSKPGKKSKPKSGKVSKAKLEPIPKGFRSVTPYLSINGAAEALEWYKKAFGAKELTREATPDGKIMHARIRIGDSIVMLSDSFQGGSTGASASSGGPAVTLHIYAKNADKVWQQAVDAGAKVKMPIDNQYWGERYGQLSDPFGHNWSVSQRVQMSRQEMQEKLEQAMAMFSQGEHPGQEGQPGQSGQVSAMTQD
ncbi:MAG TPA: VOC family protein [Candidatus Bathyarchaeia archaeon]|nr:VOC family protein [Candidatus Bathyarchaeia archaeon]